MRPAIAELTLGQTETRLTIETNLEALIADIDLSTVRDTDEAENAADYDGLAALEPEELRRAFQRFWPAMRSGLEITVDRQHVDPVVTGVEIPPPDTEGLARTSIIAFTLPAGREVSFQWAKSYGDIVVRQLGVADDIAYTGFLSGGERSPPIMIDGGVTQGPVATLTRYVAVGFDHIIPKGLDHILFVLGLFFLAPRIRALLWQISAFTLAHTVTLALGATGAVVVDPAIVEPLIALSIVYVAVENVFIGHLSPWRPVLIFAFGLLHGLGFASVLADFGLPDAQFLPALIGFNIGVELGQIAVVLLAFMAVGFWFRDRTWYRPRIAVPASLCIAATGTYWAAERALF